MPFTNLFCKISQIIVIDLHFFCSKKQELKSNWCSSSVTCNLLLYTSRILMTSSWIRIQNCCCYVMCKQLILNAMTMLIMLILGHHQNNKMNSMTTLAWCKSGMWLTYTMKLHVWNLQCAKNTPWPRPNLYGIVMISLHVPAQRECHEVDSADSCQRGNCTFCTIVRYINALQALLINIMKNTDPKHKQTYIQLLTFSSSSSVNN